MFNFHSIPFTSGIFRKETVGIDKLFDDFAGWLAAAMAGIDFDSDQKWILSRYLCGVMLELRDIFERVEWHDTVIVVCGEGHHGGVLLLFRGV